MTADSNFTPKSLSASEYVLTLFEPEDKVAVLGRNRRTGHTVQRIAAVETVATLEFQFWLRHENAAGADLFIGMNPIKEGAYSRTKDNIREIRHLYLDLDRNGDEALESIRHSAEVPAPNFVLHTSPGKHQVVWRVEGMDQPEAESLLRAMASQFGGDPAATDSTRVLRLPGFANKKYNADFVVQVHYESNRVYHSRDFLVQEESLETPRYRGAPHDPARTVSPGHMSQSEHDWTYAKRALSRGDDPEEIIRRIADFRADDKHNPEYYARHTVSKAQNSLQKANPLSDGPARGQAFETPSEDVDRNP
ncbi:MAG: DNA-primase RepB domain-containing protein [Candidatus Acidiferrales bacterium]